MPKPRLTKEEIRALRQAAQDEEIFIRQGFAVVEPYLWPEEEFEEELETSGK